MKSQPWVSACRVVQDRRTAQANRQHVQRLMNVRPSIDMSRPKALQYKRSNAKRIYMEKERQQKIQRENNRMLRNLLEIDPSRRADRKKRFSRSEASKNAAGSLNKTNRSKELDRISLENKKLLSRIINCAPTFDRHQFKQREKDHKRLLRRMAENSGNRQRPQSARGANPDRFIMEEMRADGIGGRRKGKGKKNRPKSASRQRKGMQALDNVASNRRPRTAMGMRKSNKGTSKSSGGSFES